MGEKDGMGEKGGRFQTFVTNTSHGIEVGYIGDSNGK